jgi:GAF domain-containing protein
LLEQMTYRLKSRQDLEGVVATILNDVIALHGAEFGAVQILDGDTLLLVGERGLGAPFINAFSRVTAADVSGCGRALKSGQPVVIEDVERDELLQPHRDFIKAMGFRAIQSTPLIAKSGDFVGVVTTQFAKPHVPTPIEMGTIVAYAPIAAEFIKMMLHGPNDVRHLHDRLCAVSEMA